MANLYELNKDYELIKAAFEDGEAYVTEDGEVLEAYDLARALESVQDTLESKVENYCRLHADWGADVAAIDAEMKRLRDKKKRLQNGQRDLLNRAGYILEASGKKELKGTVHTLKLSARKSVEVFDEDKVPSTFKEERKTWHISKRDISDALKKGQKVPGARWADPKVVIK